MKDLATLNVVEGANNGFDLRLVNPIDGTDLGIVIKILGRDSTEWRKVQSEQHRRRVAKVGKGGFRGLSISSEEMEQDAIALLAACTIGWKTENGDGDPKFALIINGQEIPFSTQAAVKIYNDFPWIKEQIDAGVSDRANFMMR